MRANKIQMDANTEIKGKATQINMEADADVDIKGNTSVSVKSMVGLNLEGTANAELKSSGIVTVEGRLIRLN
jgi:phage gp45-like